VLERPRVSHVADSSNGKCRTTAKTSRAFSGGSAELIRATQLPDPPVAAASRDRHRSSPGGTQVQRHKALAFRFQGPSSVTFESCFHSLVQLGQRRLVNRRSPSTPPVASALSACSFSVQPGIKSFPPSFTSRMTASIADPLAISTLTVSFAPGTDAQMVTRTISARQFRPRPRARTQRAAARAPRDRGACRVRGPSRRAPS